MSLVHCKVPCKECPFRREGGVRLYAARIDEIVSVVAPIDGCGGTFPCHKTVDHDDCDERSELQCAGAIIFAYKQGTSSQYIRICERLGGVDRALAEGDWPEIFDDVDEMLATAIDNQPKKERDGNGRSSTRSRKAAVQRRQGVQRDDGAKPRRAR